MRSYLVALALIAETAVLLMTAYVTYRWTVANYHQPWNRFSDLVPYYGGFERIVAPWAFASLLIPVCWVVLAVARRARQPNSN